MTAIAAQTQDAAIRLQMRHLVFVPTPITSWLPWYCIMESYCSILRLGSDRGHSYYSTLQFTTVRSSLTKVHQKGIVDHSHILCKSNLFSGRNGKLLVLSISSPNCAFSPLLSRFSMTCTYGSL